MLKPTIAYLSTAVVFFAIDFIWLSSANGFYRSQIGELLLEKPNLAVAGLFYVAYVAGIVVLVVMPALATGNWVGALLTGMVLGFVAYGTYDFTNLSTLKGWTVTTSLVDLAWGTFLTGLSATAGYFATSFLANKV